jgi:hypothetical protein
MVRCRVYVGIPAMVISSFNGLKCVMGNKKCKSSGPLRPYENQGSEAATRAGMLFTLILP